MDRQDERSSSLTVLSSSPPIPSDRTPTRPRGGKRPRRATSESDEVNVSFQCGRHRSESFGHSTPSPIPARPSRRRLTDVAKINAILDAIRLVHWTLKDFLNGLHQHSSPHAFRRPYGQLLDFAYVDLPQGEDFKERIGPQRRDALLREVGWKWTTALYAASLITSPASPCLAPLSLRRNSMRRVAWQPSTRISTLFIYKLQFG